MIKRTLCLVVMAGWVFASSAIGQATPQEQNATISLDVTEAHLDDVLKLLSKQSGMNFVASEDTRDLTVTMYMNQVPVQNAVDTILRANHLTLRPMEQENLFVVIESAVPRVETITKVFRLKYARVLRSAGESAGSFGTSGSLITPLFEGTSEGGGGGSGGSSGGGAAAGGGGGSMAGGGGGGLGGIGGGGGEGSDGGIVNIIRELVTEHGSVLPDPRTNSLIVTDLPEQIKKIARTIAQLDTKPQQIYIEGEVLEVKVDTLRRIGVEWGTSAGQVATFEWPSRTSFFPFSRGLLEAGVTKAHSLSTLSFTDADTILKLIATDSDVRFLARPRLLTLSNEVAEIRIVEEPVTGTVTTSQAETGTISTEPERTTVGTVLRVTPLVNDESYITMVIEPEVSRVTVSSFDSDFQDPIRRAARTTVMVKDGSTVMIAGLIDSEHTKSSRRVPGLGDIPILGAPFKRSETDREDTEILLFITPHLIKESREVVLALEREQTDLSSREQKHLKVRRGSMLKERAIVETIENIVR